MTVSMTLPVTGNSDVKSMVFSILAEEYPLKIIELTNFIKRRYGKSVTFQGVRKAILQLVEEGVLVREGNEFLVNKAWVQDSKRFLDRLYLKLVEGRKATGKATYDSISGDISVFVFNSINEMMRVWEDLSDEWFKSFKKGEYNVNCYQAAHSWEVLLHPDIEVRLMSQAKRKGIRAYILCTENTPLDQSLVKFHRRIGVRMVTNPSSSSFDKSHYIGTYGPLIIQAKYPLEVVRRLNLFFRKNTDIEDLDLAGLSAIANTKIQVKMIVIKNLEMAKQINASILSKMGLA